MKDITRIHIAKVPYDIELKAKKDLEAYISKLEAYAQDKEVLEDIEIRITELLQERGVKQNHVISGADVVAVCAQLGDPREFMSDGDVVTDDIDATETRKRLYRNSDTALVGGVVSGVASYFGISLILTRLAFVFLTLITAGSALFVYVILWLIVPVAKTAAEKLTMTGRPVTLASIRQLNEEAVAPNDAPRMFRRVVTTFIGLGSVIMAIGIVAGGIYGLVALNQVSDSRNVNEVIINSIGSNYPLTLTLGGIAAAILVAFLVLTAYASFKQIFTKRVWVTGVVLIAAGLTSFGAAIASGAYGAYDLSVQVQKSIVTKQITVPAGFDAINELSVTSAKDYQYNAQVQYIVDPKTRIELVTPYNDAVKVVVEGHSAKIQYINDDTRKNNDYRYTAQTSIRIYGPALTKVSADQMSLHYEGAAQNDLTVEAKKGSTVYISGSRIQNLTTIIDKSLIDAQSSTIGKITADLSSTSSLQLGTVESLTVNAPTICAAQARNEIRAINVNEGFVTLNDAKITKTQYQDSCMQILSAGDERIDNEYGS